MAEVTGDRFCPICENIVPREFEGVSVKISPARKILLHIGCAELVASSLNVFLEKKEKNGDED